MAEIEIWIWLAIDAASQSAVLPIYVVSTPKPSMRGWLLPRVASQVAKAKPKNRHVRVLKQPLVAATEEKTSTQNQLKRPQIRKAAVLLGEASREIWQEENGKREEGDRGRGGGLLSLRLQAMPALLQRKWQRRATPQWVGYTQCLPPRRAGLELLNFAVYCLSRWRNASF